MVSFLISISNVEEGVKNFFFMQKINQCKEFHIMIYGYVRVSTKGQAMMANFYRARVNHDMAG